MSGGHALRERAETLADLRQIVQAMKNLAFAELQRLTRMAAPLAQARDSVMQALRSLDDGAEAASAQDAPAAWLVIGAERGFCGAFNARLAEAAEGRRAVDPRQRFLLASRRLVDGAGAGWPDAIALPGCAAIDDADAVLERWMSALEAEALRAADVGVLHTDATGVVALRLWPEPQAMAQAGGDVSPGAAASLPSPPSPPMHYLPLPALRQALRRQARALLLRSALHASLAQENRSRLAQMERAQDHLDDLGRALQRLGASRRQAEITNELETLMSSFEGAAASASGTL